MTQYGYDARRDGYNACETTLTSANAGRLARQWSFELKGPSLTEPVVANGVKVGGVPTDLVYVGDSLGNVDAVDRESGALVWSRALGSTTNSLRGVPCNVNGVQGAFAIDRSRNRLYLADQGAVYALDLGTGATEPSWPVTISTDPVHEEEWGALHLYHGSLYATIGGTCADVPPYTGRVIQISTATATITATWCATTCGSGDGGGIWGYGGVSIDPVTRGLFTATGNTIVGPSNSQDGEHVVALRTPGLRLVAANDTGVPSGGDRDFGSTPVVFTAPGCPTELAVLNKYGLLYLYRESTLGSGPVQMLQIADPSSDRLIGVVAYSPATNMVYVADPSNAPQSPYLHGMLALRVLSDCQLAFGWDTSVGKNLIIVSPPTLAGGVVYFGDGIDHTEYAMDQSTGAILWSVREPLGQRLYAAPTVADGSLLFVTTGRRLGQSWLYSYRVPGT